ncbi:hypothetical protein LJC52_04110, partial [Bacteroidales bacterium OttesenSCG-928-A17]|nr:hypothetical protein [Bacteroidales bacterium OttesenSCG-928-A17]
LYGYTFNPKEIEKLKEATLCSETISEAIDFSVIGSSFTYSWEATATPPEISGYQLSGTGTIPAMALSNSSTTRKTLTYTVSVLLSGNTLFQFEYDLIVLPLLPESLNLTSPISNEELTSPSVTFRWSAVNDATYDLYLWESDGIEPSQPIATDIGFTSYSNSTFCQYGKSYAWKIVAKGECNSIESEIALFSIRKLPDLHVTNITSDDIVYTGNQARIIWKVQNDGEGNILPEDWWYDRIWLMPNLGTENPMLNARLLHEKRNKATLETGQYYIDTVTVDIPERISGQFYLVVASDMYDIASIDLSSVGDVLPLPYSPDLSGNPYSYLSAGTSVRTNYNRILEAGENNDQSDNFFYKSISVHVPSLANLQISALEIPDNITETLSHTATATINNVGQSPIQDKTWRDVLYISSQPVFDSQSATLIESKYRDTDLGINEFYSVTFNFVAPVDSLGKYYYFVRTDVDNTVFEENDEDNILRSNEITVLPYWMNEDDYTVLLRFYTETAGQNWKNQWRTASNRIANYWKGVTFEEGRVSELSLENNNLTGELSSGLFELPKLIRLNLYNNNLSGDLDELFSATNLPDSLVSLNLGKNNFGTVIPASISNLAYLEELDLSYNKFNSMENMLPAHIVNLNLKYQDLATKDSIGFTLLPDLSIPEIARYDHINRNFDFHPLYQLELNGNNILALYYNADSYRWSGVTRWEWAYNSGLLFTLQQTSGLLQGSSSSLVLTFEKGDANIDQLVDILDVQHTLNYIFNEHVGPFNKVAGNTYFDASINVQDIVATVNIILDKDESLRSGSEIDQETDLNAPNSIYIENGKLLLKLTEPVAALDISLEGVNENQIRMMLKSSEFQSVCRNTNDGARLIIFSPSNSFIPVGETVLAEMREAGAKIRNAKLSSPEATNVEVDIELKKPTAIPQIGVDDVQVFTNSGFIYFRIPGQSEYISASLSNVQGILLSKQEYHAIEKGLYRMNDMEMPQGVYILTFSVKTPSGIFTKNSKLIISK